MKKEVMKRCFFGAPMGLTVYFLFLLCTSWIRGDGELHIGYYLIRIYGTELRALTAAGICAMLIGVIWAAASLIFQTDWSLTKQTVLHYLVCTVPSIGINFLAGNMPRSASGLLQYLRLFGCVYALVWVIQYLGMRRRVRQMNAMLNGSKE